ncbi:MAG: tyrosine-protein phosphatase [Candidatus Binatia bacterium]
MSDVPSSPPIPGTYWVVPSTLLAGAYPGGRDAKSTEERMAALLNAGIHSVISLMSEEEAFEAGAGEIFLPYEDTLERIGEERGIVVEIERYAIEDANTLTEQAMELVLDAIDAEIEGRNSPTFVHCSDGNARTGVVVGCYLARHGIATGKDALGRLKELRACDPVLAGRKSPETMTEEKFVLRWRESR